MPTYHSVFIFISDLESSTLITGGGTCVGFETMESFYLEDYIHPREGFNPYAFASIGVAR